MELNKQITEHIEKATAGIVFLKIEDGDKEGCTIQADASEADVIYLLNQFMGILTKRQVAKTLGFLVAEADVFEEVKQAQLVYALTKMQTEKQFKQLKEVLAKGETENEQ